MENNVLLIFGGNSFEHDISIITALTIYNRSKACKYNLLPLYLSKNNEWFLFCGKNFSVENFKNFELSYKNNFKKAYFKNGKNLFYKSGLFEKKISFCSVLNCCHGGNGENGEITAFFNQLNIPITSGSYVAQTIGIDKIISKYYFSKINLPVVKSVEFNKSDFNKNQEKIMKKIKKINYPVIIKPASLGSSIGIEIAKNESELLERLYVAFEFDENVLVEKAILDNLREFNVACLYYNGEVIVSEIDEPKRTDEILSFKDKYIGEGGISTKNSSNKTGSYFYSKIKEISLNEEVKNNIKQYAKKIYEKLNCIGPVRVDFLMDKNENLFVNEINTVPGSLAYYFFIPSIFKTMNDYVEALVDESIKFFNNKNKIKKEFITKLI